MIVALLFLLLVATVIVVGVLTPPTEVDVQEWAKAHAIALDGANETTAARYLRHYLKESKRSRRLGAVVGNFVGMVASWSLSLDRHEHADFINLHWILGGYLVGGIYAEFALSRPADTVGRVAALDVRQKSDYRPRRLSVILAIVTFAVVLLAISGARGDRLASATSRQKVGWPASNFVVYLTIALLIQGGGEFLAQRIAARPRRMTEPSLVAADDAIRSQSIHTVYGSILALELSLMALVLTRLADSGYPGLHNALRQSALVALLAALFCWRYYSHRAWRVPKRSLHEAAAGLPSI